METNTKDLKDTEAYTSLYCIKAKHKIAQKLKGTATKPKKKTPAHTKSFVTAKSAK